MIFQSLKTAPLFLRSLAVCMAPAAQAQAARPAQEFITVSGSAAYLQRIAMPPEAVLTVRVEDVSRADAGARVLAETREAFGGRQVPLAFALKIPRTAVDPRMSYAVRATITVGPEIRFTTTRNYPVLTRGAPNTVDVMLAAVQPGAGVATGAIATPAPAAPTQPASGVSFALPATFAGVLPCADCAGIAHTLTLRADGLYRLRRTYLGKPDGPFAETGRWTADARGKQLTLVSGQDTLFFAVQPDGALRVLDRGGHAIQSSFNQDLRRTAKVDPVSDAAATNASPQAASAALQDTYWKLVELNGQPAAMQPGQEREVRITLSSEGTRLSGFSGCNALSGAYALDGQALKFSQMASTMRMCEPGLDALERKLLDALMATTGQRVDGQRLSLLAGERVLARFEAVYLK